MDARAFAQARESLAAEFAYRARLDTVAISARFLSDTRQQAVALLRKSLIEPRFEAAAIERVRAQVLAGLRIAMTNPGEIAQQDFFRQAFPDHPYGRDLYGTPASVTALTRADLMHAHGRALAKNNLYVVAVGDITAEDLGELLDQLFGALPETAAALPPPTQMAVKGGVSVIPFATPQSVAVFGHAGIRQEDPDFYAAYLLSIVLGGGFESRLTQELREKRGLTYGVFAQLVQTDLAVLYLGRFATTNDRLAEAIAATRAQWETIATGGISADELARAKTYLTGSYPLRFAGNAPIANVLASLQLAGLPIDYIATRNDKLRAVSLEQVNRVARRLIRPQDLHFVVVGMPEPRP